MVQEMLDAESVNDITDCSKLIGFKYIYRVRVGSNRVFFLHHPPEGDVTLLYIVSRGEAYGKRYILRLRDKDV
jgi:mRNA-degrading endonuclease RelE of RelBE toxin-antitoxin system